jgi:hypothetical protein
MKQDEILIYKLKGEKFAWETQAKKGGWYESWSYRNVVW